MNRYLTLTQQRRKTAREGVEGELIFPPEMEGGVYPRGRGIGEARDAYREREKNKKSFLEKREAIGIPRENEGYFYDGLDLSGARGIRIGGMRGLKTREATGLNDKVETLTYKTSKGLKYFFYDKETKQLWETSGNEYRRLLKLRNYNPDDPKLRRRQMKQKAINKEKARYDGYGGNTEGGRLGDIRKFDVRPATMEDLKILEGKLSSIVKKGLPKDPKRRSLIGSQSTLAGRRNNLRPRTRNRRRPDIPTRNADVATTFNTTLGKFNPTPSATTYDRGLRDPRTAGGNILRGSRTRTGFKTRYQSALEQAVIDRRIRNTVAENKLENEIKKVREGEKVKLDNLRLLKDTADQTLEALKLKNQRLLHDHNVVVRGNQNATLLGSDAEELNKLLTSGRISYISVKDMVRKGEISDIATIHQLDFHKGRDQKIKKLVSLMEETADYQVNKSYPFREVNEDGTISIVSGFYQRGGERGTNLQLLMPDGRRKVVRKRDLLDPNDPRLDNLQPITSNAPSIAYVSDEDSIDSHIELGIRPAQNPSSDLWLGGGQRTPSISSSSEDIFGDDEPTPKPEVEEPKPDLAVAQYNNIMETMSQRIAFQKARESELKTLEVPELRSGLFGLGGNAGEVERITQRRKQVEDHIRREAKTIKLQKRKANTIAVEKGFEIPFVESGEDIIPARALLKSMTGESPRPDVSPEQFAESLEQLRKVQRETGELTDEEEEELEEAEPEPEPSISGGVIDLEDEAEENINRTQFVKDLQTTDGRNYKIEYLGYPLIVDSQTDEVIDPAGKLPILPLNIFSSPTGNFIRWESETQKIGIENLIRESQKPPPEPKPEVGDEKVIGWDRNEVKPSLIKKFAEQNRPNSESLMIWSTRFPDERDTPKKAVFITRDQLEAKLNTLDLGKKERENFLAKFDAEKGKGKVEFAMNNKKIWKGLGLEGTPSASSIIDYRTSVLQLQ